MYFLFLILACLIASSYKNLTLASLLEKHNTQDFLYVEQWDFKASEIFSYCLLWELLQTLKKSYLFYRNKNPRANSVVSLLFSF